MYKFSEMIIRQKDYVQKMREHANNFIKQLNKNDIETILLSGSVSRGDYCPGVEGGMIDLIVMKKENSKITVEELFGPNENPYIPYHCIKWNGEWFAILFTEFINCERFKEFTEPRKFSIMEAKIIYDLNGNYSNELKNLNIFVEQELKKMLKDKLGYLKYIIGKEKRWKIREAYLHMHNNLNIAIEIGICCLYYFNGKYAPADDRKLYYSLELPKIPLNYDRLIESLFDQKMSSKEDYERRKKIFFDEFIKIME